MKERDFLAWAALAAALATMASAEYELARACGFGQYVAAGVPAALDIYTLRALRVHRDVFAAVVAMIAVNAASHLVTAGLLPVSVPLVVAVSAIAPLVLWRVHALGERPAEGLAVPAPVPAAAEAVPPVPEAVPDPVRPAPGMPVLGPFQPLPELPAALPVPDSGTSPEQARQHPEPDPVPAAGTAGADPGTGEAGPVPEDGAAGLFEQRVGLAREWLRDDPDLTGTAIAERFGTGDSYARRVKRAALASG